MRSPVTVAIVALALAGVVALLVLSRPSAPLTGSTVTPPANIPTVESSAGASATPPASQTPREDPTDSPSPSAPASAAVSTRLPSPSPQPSAPCGDHLIIYDGPEPTITNQVRSPEIFVAEVVGVADAALVPIGEHEPGEGVGAIRSDAYRRLTLDVRDVAKGPGGPPAIRSIMVPGGTVGCAHFMVAGMPDLTVGRLYAFFVEARSVTLPGGPSAPVAFTFWPISDAGKVETPLDGKLTIDAFVAAVRSASE